MGFFDRVSVSTEPLKREMTKTEFLEKFLDYYRDQNKFIWSDNLIVSNFIENNPGPLLRDR